jgi:hypothetical protein
MTEAWALFELSTATMTSTGASLKESIVTVLSGTTSGFV